MVVLEVCVRDIAMANTVVNPSLILDCGGVDGKCLGLFSHVTPTSASKFLTYS